MKINKISGQNLINGAIEQKSNTTSLFPVRDNITLSNSNYPSSSEKKKATVLLYISADCDITDMETKKIRELENLTPYKNINIIAQFDQRHWNKSECMRYDINKKNYEHNYEDDPNITDYLGKTDMSDPKNLSEFLQYGFNKYPAEKYILLCSTHGRGWRGTLFDGTTEIDEMNSGKFEPGWMKIEDFRDAIIHAENKTGKKLDILAMESCVMANSEAAYELKDTARYYIASENLMQHFCLDYDKIFPEIDRQISSNADTRKIAESVVKINGHTEDVPTLSCIDFSKMDNLAKSLDELGKAFIESNENFNNLKYFFRNTTSYHYLKDLGIFCKSIVEDKVIKDNNLKIKAWNILETLKDTVVAKENAPDSKFTEGITIDLPSYEYPKEALNTFYDLDIMKKAKNWAEMTKRFNYN